MKEFIAFVFGTDKSVGIWLAFVFVMLLGWLFMNIMNVKKRDILGIRAPLDFNFKFFIFDNIKRIIVNLIGVWVYIRFVPEFEPMGVAAFAAFVVGGAWEKFLISIRNKIKDKSNFKF